MHGGSYQANRQEQELELRGDTRDSQRKPYLVLYVGDTEMDTIEYSRIESQMGSSAATVVRRVQDDTRDSIQMPWGCLYATKPYRADNLNMLAGCFAECPDSGAKMTRRTIDACNDRASSRQPHPAARQFIWQMVDVPQEYTGEHGCLWRLGHDISAACEALRIWISCA
jgi:hypothetical protein